jgi:hypothetical protein
MALLDNTFGTQPRSVRTNNPGAIEYGDFARSMGATGSDGRYAVFPDMETGYRAMERLLGTYVGRGQNTIASIIGGTPDNPDRAWAPRSVDNNSTDQYITSVARSLGLRPDQPLTQADLPRVAEAMAAYEAGRAVPRTSDTMTASAPEPAVGLGGFFDTLAGQSPQASTTAPASDNPLANVFSLLSGSSGASGQQQSASSDGATRARLAAENLTPDTQMQIAVPGARQLDLSRLRAILQSRGLLGTGA